MFAPPKRSPSRRQRLSSPPPPRPQNSSPSPRRQRLSSPPPRPQNSSPSPRRQRLSSPPPRQYQDQVRYVQPDYTSINPRSPSSDTGSNPSALEPVAYTGEDRSVNYRDPQLLRQLRSSLGQIELGDYRTPFQSPETSPRMSGTTITALPSTIQSSNSQNPQQPRGGKYSKNVYKKGGKKEVLGKDRVIYKMKGSNKEYVKSKGTFIPVSEYKKLKK